MNRMLPAVVFLLSLTAHGISGAPAPAANPDALAHQATTSAPEEAAKATAALRAMGPAGLRSLMTVYRAEIDAHYSRNAPNDQPEWLRISAAIDAVSQQRDGASAGLYWYTDLEQATAAARKTNHPILSLRLLGNLTDEYSCANSRFFRAALYANSDISAYLREHFILHWQSVRPAPRITIDFGDGRKLERTITGNSIHYVLDQEGNVLDALPGLYGPAAFKRNLIQIEARLRLLQTLTEKGRRIAFSDFLRKDLMQTATAWSMDLNAAGVTIDRSKPTRTLSGPDALDAAPIAVTKRIVEIDLLRMMNSEVRVLEANTDLSAWKALAALHHDDAVLDQRSIDFVRMQLEMPGASGTALSNATRSSVSDTRLTRIVQEFEQSMAMDTVRNEYLVRTRLKSWLAKDGGGDLKALNERVYAELFLTPSQDPWLGLYSEYAYTGLAGAGVNR